MKIIQVLAGAQAGGAEMAYIDMCIAMHEAGMDILAVTRKNDLRINRLKEHNVPYKTLAFGGIFDFKTKWQLRKIIKEFSPQIVMGWMSRASKFIPAGNGKFLKICRLGNYYKLKYFKDTDHFITITPDIKEYLVNNGVDRNKITFINNFAETEDTNKKIDRSSLDTPDNAKVILTLSRLHDAKALDILIKAAVNFPDLYLWLAGDGPLKNELIKLATDLGIKNRVKFLGWRSDRAELLNSADICCFPSRFEPFGTVFVQAWAHKIPVIVSNAKGPSQFVEDNNDCLLFEIDNVEQLTEKIDIAMNDKKLCNEITVNGYEKYKDSFTKHHAVKTYLNTYNDCILKHKTA